MSNFEEYCRTRVTIKTECRLLACDERGWEHYAMECKLSYQGRTLKTIFKQGTGRKNAPSAADVIACLLLDARATSTDFASWCDDLDLDTDSRKALDTFLQCQENGRKLQTLLGDDYSAFEREAQDY
jgi:hypothetical protein